MDNLIAWLRVQLDEDERVAKSSPFERWALTGPPGCQPTLCGTTSVAGGTSNAHLAESVAFHDPKGATLAHAARWDPARVLAEVEARRRVLGLTDFGAQFPDAEGGYDSACEDVVKLLALPYADRPGYRQEWRP